MKILLRKDSRDLHFHHRFGQAFDLDVPQNFDDSSIPEKIQPIGNVECTCYTTEYIAQNKTKKEYDIDELFSRVPHSSDGADPRDVFGEAIKNGLLIKGTQTYDKPFSSYWRADTGYMDAFDNVRSAMLLAQSPIAIGSYWYREWFNLPYNSLMPIGKTPVSGHMYAGKGWVLGTATVDGKPALVIEWWGGGTYLMPRETFNDALKQKSMGAWVLSDKEIDEKKTRSLLEWLSDILTNIGLYLHQKFLHAVPPTIETATTTPPIETPTEPQVPILEKFCLAIRDYEGSPGDLNYRNNNPGNARFYKGGYLSIYGDVKCDPHGFAIFPTYEQGWLYLKNLVKGKIMKHSQWTIKDFFYSYAPVTDENSPELYAVFVANRCGVTPDYLIKNLI